MIDFTAVTAPVRALQALSYLPAGWNFGRGFATTEGAHMNALAVTLITSRAGAVKFEYFPEDDGGVLTIAYRENDSAEILARADGAFEIAIEDENGLSPAKECKTLGLLQADLEQHGWQLQKSSDSFTRFITAPEKTVTRLLRFDPAMAGFQLSTQDALPRKNVRAVPTLNFTIPVRSGDRPRYSGESQLRNLLTEAS